jgi:hemoglobin
MSDEPELDSFYDAVGGMPFFTKLVDAFYDRVERDPLLLALYPEPEDLGPARERLRLFLAQYWGGPTTYSDTRGHPRLRMRHAGFVIDELARDRWLHAMRGAMDQLNPPTPYARALMDYFEMAADAMRNA